MHLCRGAVMRRHLPAPMRYSLSYLGATALFLAQRTARPQCKYSSRDTSSHLDTHLDTMKDKDQLTEVCERHDAGPVPRKRKLGNVAT